MPGRSPAPRPKSDSHVRTNRRFWEAGSDAYDRRHTASIAGANAAAWGLWRIPESSLRLLGAVRGTRMLELGCGAARWSIALAEKGARPIGLDATRSQLDKARRLVRESKARVPLLQANAERIPFRDATFDTVFCDWGAMTFCDPARTVPECARVLRPGGRLVFSTASPLRYVAFDAKRDGQSRRLERSYFDLRRVVLGDTVEFQLPYGEWIGLFARSGLSVERLLETRPELGARSSYVDRKDAPWARGWPMEAIWSVQKSVPERTRSSRRQGHVPCPIRDYSGPASAAARSDPDPRFRNQGDNPRARRRSRRAARQEVRVVRRPDAGSLSEALLLSPMSARHLIKTYYLPGFRPRSKAEPDSSKL
jgi:ubiquinone/menaquinone biosynthesis C-methylase UbiE